MSAFEAFIAQLCTWQAILDISLIAAGLFYLYRTLYNPGTWKNFISICLAFVFFVFASILNLEPVA